MKTKLALLGVCSMVTFGDTYNRNISYPDRISQYNHIVERPTLQRNPSGSIEIPFYQFRRLGFEHDLAAKVANDIFDSPYEVARTPNARYVVTQTRDKSSFSVSIMEETVRLNEMIGKYYIRNEMMKFSGVLHFHLSPAGQSTVHRNTVYILFDNRLTGTFFWLFSKLGGGEFIDEKIKEVTRYIEDTYEGIYANPGALNELTESLYSPEELNLLRSTFELKRD